MRIQGMMALAVVASVVAADEALAFSTVGNGWDGPGTGAAVVKFNIVGGTPDITTERDLVLDALADWVTTASLDITFQEVTTSGQAGAIDFYFTTSLGAPHSYTSDGAFGTLALGFYPDDINADPLAGDVIFDEAETWTTGQVGAGSCSASSCDLYYVALHEIGHALGLAHPDDENNLSPGRIMNPFFNPSPGLGFGSFDTIQTDDINGVCSLYSCTGLGSVVPVPEPGTGALLALGLAMLSRRRRS